MTWTLSAHRLSVLAPLFPAQSFEPDGFVKDMAAAGMRLRVLGCSYCHLQAAGTLGVGWRPATESGNYRCSRQEVLVGMVAV
jgi:hypothetical protein